MPEEVREWAMSIAKRGHSQCNVPGVPWPGMFEKLQGSQSVAGAQRACEEFRWEK